MADPIILFGSAHSFGKTRKILEWVMGSESIPLIDLSTLRINPYEYKHQHQEDDYIPLMESVLQNHELMIWATPVYWYGPSTIMKIFIDRITDLISIRKDLGRQLKGKKLFIITSFGTSLPRGFEEVFEQICDYLEMNYLGCSFFYTGTDLQLAKGNEASLQKARQILFG